MQIYGSGEAQNTVGLTGALADVDPAKFALRTSQYPNQQRGSYRLSASTGLLTLVAAGTASAGLIFAFRNAGTGPQVIMAIKHLRLTWQTITDFTASQRIGLQAFVARTFTASCSGGTALPGTAGGFKLDSRSDASKLTDARISTTGELTAGTHTLDTSPMLELVGNSNTLAVGGASGASQQFVAELNMRDPGCQPLLLGYREGLIVRNTVLMGAAGTAVVKVEVEWMEVLNY